MGKCSQVTSSGEVNMDVVRQYWLWRLRNAYLMANALRIPKQFRTARPDELSAAQGGRVSADREDFQETVPLVFHTGAGQR